MARCPCGAPGAEKDFRRSIRLGIPMSPKTSSVSDEADALDWSHLHNLKGICENPFQPRERRTDSGPFGTCKVWITE
jgi:hypothetical protein